MCGIPIGVHCVKHAAVRQKRAIARLCRTASQSLGPPPRRSRKCTIGKLPGVAIHAVIRFPHCHDGQYRQCFVPALLGFPRYRHPRQKDLRYSAQTANLGCLTLGALPRTQDTPAVQVSRAKSAHSKSDHNGTRLPRQSPYCKHSAALTLRSSPAYRQTDALYNSI